VGRLAAGADGGTSDLTASARVGLRRVCHTSTTHTHAHTHTRTRTRTRCHEIPSTTTVMPSPSLFFLSRQTPLPPPPAPSRPPPHTQVFLAAEEALKAGPGSLPNSLVLHFGKLFDVKRLEGMFPKMNVSGGVGLVGNAGGGGRGRLVRGGPMTRKAGVAPVHPRSPHAPCRLPVREVPWRLGGRGPGGCGSGAPAARGPLPAPNAAAADVVVVSTAC
jgi:hypothetical protein